MKMYPALAAFVTGIVCASKIGIAQGSKISSQDTLENTQTAELQSAYASFLEKHGRKKAEDSFTYSQKLAAFARTRAKVAAHNSNPHRSWTAEVNFLADHTDVEFRQRLGFRRMGQWWNRSTVMVARNDQPGRLPDSVNWAKKLTTATHLKDQGACGSCWAVAAIGALETHLEIASDKVTQLSHKELIDCVPNPKNCGGTGGCEGATGELAFQYVADHGLSMNTVYAGNDEATETCDARKGKGADPTVRATRFMKLPENKLQPLMQAVVSGPVVVSVDGTPWSSYSSGVFDGCDKDATVNHAVLLMGYGKDTSHDKNYWLLRNSWGSSWGEKGYMRIQRHSSDTGDEGFCGTDYDPKQGVGCDGGPKTLPVCGMCGVLSDSCYPVGVSHV